MASRDWTDNDENSFNNAQNPAGNNCANNPYCNNNNNNYDKYCSSNYNCCNCDSGDNRESHCSERDCRDFGKSNRLSNNLDDYPHCSDTDTTSDSYTDSTNDSYTYDHNQTFTDYMSQSCKKNNQRPETTCSYTCSSSYCDPTTRTSCCCFNENCSKSSYVSCSKANCCQGVGGGRYNNEDGSCNMRNVRDSSCERCRAGLNVGRNDSCRYCQSVPDQHMDQYEVTAKVLFGSVGAISALKQTNKSKKGSKKK